MADQILTLNGKQAAAGSGVINIVPPDYISGLKMIWNSATSISVTTGAACRPSDSLLMMPAALITKSGLTLTASTWYHLYLYMNGTNPDVEIVTTAPAAAYFGSGCAKAGDTTRRYLGSIRTDASGNILQFTHIADMIAWASNVRVITAGTATVPTAFDCSTGAGPTSIDLFMRVQIGNGAQMDYGYLFDASIGTTSANAQLTVGAYPNFFSDLHSWVSYSPSSGLMYQSHAGSPVDGFLLRYRFSR